MNITFVNPPGPRYLFRGSICTYLSKSRYVWKPKDFILLSGRVPPEAAIRFLDASINGVGEPSALARVVADQPDAVVMALSSIVWEHDLAFLRELRERVPRTPIAVFGEVLLERPFADAALKYADTIIYDPLRADLEAFVRARSVEHDPLPSPKKTTRVVEIHVPRHELFDNLRYRWPFVKHFRYAAVYTQFGCPFTCSYCTESVTNVTYRPAANVLEELRYVKRLGYREINLADASFGYPRDNAVALLEAMLAERFDFAWSCYTYPGLADAGMLELMRRSGCHTVVIGVDSADPQLLRKYHRTLSPERLREFVRHCGRLGIDVCGDFILGFDEDTRESCLRTIELALELDLAYASFNIATPMMGSSVRDIFRAKGLLSDTTGYDTAGLMKVAGTSHLTADELLGLRNLATRRFYFRPAYLWRRLRRLRGPEELLIKLVEMSGIVSNWLRGRSESVFGLGRV